MKHFNVLLPLIFLMFLASNAFAELKIIRQISVDGVAFGANQKLVLDDGRIYWIKPHITSSPDSEPNYLELEDFFDDTPVSRIVVNHPPIFSPRGDSNSLIFLGNANADWLAIKLNTQLTRIDKKVGLKSFLGVTGSARVKGGYVVAGLIKDKALSEESIRKNEKPSFRPILAKLDELLKLAQELKFPDKGQINNVFAQSGKIYATLSYDNKPPEMLELSSELSILKKHSIPIGFAMVIPLRDGGFAITYTAIPNKDIMIERRDAKFRLLWKKKLFTEKGISSVFYSLCELQNGLGLVGQVDSRLVVARVGMDGQSLRITKGPEKGLYFDPFDPFLLGVRGNDIHIRGIGQNPDSGDSESFHYVETP